MLSEKEKEIIVDLAKKYGVKRIIIFGSASKEYKDYRDIDLAVDGVPDRLFFQFYGELILSLPKPVDLIDLSKRNNLTEIIEEEGILIYG